MSQPGSDGSHEVTVTRARHFAVDITTPNVGRKCYSLQEVAAMANRTTAQQLKDRVVFERNQVDVPEWMKER